MGRVREHASPRGHEVGAGQTRVNHMIGQSLCMEHAHTHNKCKQMHNDWDGVWSRLASMIQALARAAFRLTGGFHPDGRMYPVFGLFGPGICGALEGLDRFVSLSYPHQFHHLILN